MSKNPNRVLAVIIGLVVLAVAIVTVLSTTKSAVVIDRSTPAGAVQVYLKAILAGKNAEAASMLSPNSVCTIDDVDRAYVVDTSRVLLVDSTTTGSNAEVRVRVEIPSGGPLGDFMTEDHTFRLSNTSGSWLLTGIPWPLFDCGIVAK
ncbi:MAG TPA: hypothetical protein VGJ85_04285 [Candidatus Nanopelagicaceae bacterium]